MHSLTIAGACVIIAACNRAPGNATIGPLDAIEVAIKAARPHLGEVSIRSVYVGEDAPIPIREALQKLSVTRSAVPELDDKNDDFRVWYVVLRQGRNKPGADIIVLVDASAGKSVLFRFVG